MTALKQFLDVLDKTQWLPAHELASYQRRPLGKLVRHAYETVPFYSDRIGVLFRKDGTIDWDRWDEVPFLTKSDIHDHADQLTSRKIPEKHGEVRVVHTSGTTGPPTAVKKTALTTLAANAASARFHDWHGIDRNLKLASIRLAPPGKADYPHGHHADVWSGYADYVDCRGPYALLTVNTPLHEQAEWLSREKPDYLHTHAGNAGALAAFIADNPTLAEALDLKKILTLAEILTDETRRLCREHLDTDIADCYSSHECGIFALQCPTNRHYHIQSEVIRVEVLDESGKPTPPGDYGQVIATPLYNLAMPLIRYKVEDYAVPGETCTCGRHLPVLDCIAGRTRNFFRFPDGSKVQPNFGHRLFIDSLRPRQWQVAQTGPLVIEVRYVPAEDRELPDLDRMTARIHRLLRKDLNVRYRAMNEIPLTPGGKFEDYVCELPDDV